MGWARCEPFGTTTTGKDVLRVSMETSSLEVDVLTWGAVVQSIRVKDGAESADVVLGFESLEQYEQDTRFVGAVVGRYANRIASGTFAIDGTAYHVPQNDRGHALHGGREGFHRQVWEIAPEESGDAQSVTLEHVSPDGHMGFPGTVRASCTYRLEESALSVEFRAVTDRPTVVSMSQHSYFNLGGGRGSTEHHELWVGADHYLPVDDTGLPLSHPEEVAGSPFDFRVPTTLGPRLRIAHDQLLRAQGYDHCFLLDARSLDRPAMRLVDPLSRRSLEVSTDQPGIQLYSGNHLDGTVAGKRGVVYRQGDGICLESQQLPDAPNRPEFGDVVLRPTEEYVARTTWRFGTA